MRRNIIQIHRSFRINFKLGIQLLQSNWRLFVFSLIIGLVGIYSFPQIVTTLTFNKTPSIGLVGNFTPSTLPLFLQKEISVGLTTLTSDNSATSGAAISWSVSPDGKSITFNLDRNLFWQDGTKFDTSQINYNLKGVEVKRLSLHSLQFNFKEPFAPLPVIVSQPLFKNGLIGLGKYKVEGIKFNGRFISTVQMQNMQNGTKVTYKFFPTEQMAVLALKLGIINKVQNIHTNFNLQSDPHYQVTSQISPDTQAVLFINLRKDASAEKSFRQSLSYALPDTFIQGQSAISSLPQNSWGKTDAVKKYPQNIDLAKSEVEKLSSKSAKPKIILSTSQELRPVAEVVADSWNKIGVRTTLNIVDNPPENFDVYLTYLSLSSDPDQYALWHSTQIGNISGYKSFKADRLLEDGRKTFDLKERTAIYSDFEKALSEDIPAIFLYYPKIYVIQRTSQP